APWLDDGGDRAPRDRDDPRSVRRKDDPSGPDPRYQRPQDPVQAARVRDRPPADDGDETDRFPGQVVVDDSLQRRTVPTTLKDDLQRPAAFAEVAPACH